MANKTKVVCLGGGYVGNFLAKTLKPAIRKGLLELTVVDRNNFQAFHGLVAEMVTGKIQPNTIISPERRILKPAQFFNGEIEEIDFSKQMVQSVELSMANKLRYLMTI